MLARLRLHRADDGELVHDRRALRHQRADLHAGELGGNGAERPAAGVPGLGSQVSNWLGAPQSQRRMQCFCSFFACSANAGMENSPAEAADRDRAGAAGEPLEEHAAVQRVLRRGTVSRGEF